MTILTYYTNNVLILSNIKDLHQGLKKLKALALYKVTAH